MNAKPLWQRLLSFFPTFVNGASGTAPSVDWTQGSVQVMTLDAATVTPTFVAPPAGAQLTFLLTQDGLGGRTLVWPADVSWIGGAPPLLLLGAGQTTLVNLYFDGTTYFGSLSTAATPAFVSVKAFGPAGSAVLDSGPTFQRAVNFLAGTGIALWIPDDTYTFATTVALKSNLFIWGGDGVTLVSTLASGTGNPNNAILDYPQTTTGINTTLAAPATVGSQTVTLTSTAGYAVGGFLVFAEAASLGFRTAIYQIRHIAGAAVTLDRPVLYPFLANDPVQGVIPIQSLVIKGNKMKMTGTGDRYIELFYAWQCLVQDIQFDGTSGMVSDSIMSFDNPSYGSIGERLTIQDGTATVTLGLRVESGESCVYRDCTVRNITGTGILLGDCAICTLENCTASGCTGSGAALSGNSTTNQGCFSCNIRGGIFTENGTGLLVERGSSNNTVLGVAVAYNTGIGVSLTTTGTLTDNSFIGCAINNNGSNGINLGNASVDTSIECCQVTNNTGAAIFVDSGTLGTSIASTDWGGALGLQCRGPCDVSNARGSCSNNTILLDNANSFLRISSSSFRPSGAVQAVVLSAAGAKLVASGINLSLPVNGTALLTNNATAVAEVTNFTASGASSFGFFPNAGAIRAGAGCDVSGCGTPIVTTGTGALSQVQDSGEFTDATTNGTVTMSQVQARSNVVKPTGALTGAVTYNIPKGLVGWRGIFANATSNAFAASVGVTGGTSITVAQGDTAMVWSDGTNMHRATADSAGV